MARRPRRNRTFLALFSIVMLATVAGCIQEPTMSLHSAGIRGASLQGVLLNITMSVRNDNGFDVMVRNVTTDVTLAGRHRLPTVTASPNVWLPSDRSTLVTVPVVIPWDQIAPLLSTTLTSPQISYHAIGFADVTATRALAIDVNAYRLEDTGSFSRNELIAASNRRVAGIEINAVRDADL